MSSLEALGGVSGMEASLVGNVLPMAGQAATTLQVVIAREIRRDTSASTNPNAAIRPGPPRRIPQG